MRGPDAERKRDGSRSSLVWDVLADVIAARAAQTGRAALDIVDVGAGTGGFAVSIAAQGHRVTVVDPSPDALAAAGWRAGEAGVTLTEVQGEAADLPDLVGVPGADGGGADLVICHSVLEYVDSPPAALAAVARVLRPGGTVSVLAANTVAAVLQRALAGKYAEARAMLPGTQPSGAAPGPEARATPARGMAQVARRFTLPELAALIEGAGLQVGDAHGIRVFSGLLPGAPVDLTATEALRDLEEAAASCPPLRDIATRLHVLGYQAGLPGLIAKTATVSGPVSQRIARGDDPPYPPVRACGPRKRGCRNLGPPCPRCGPAARDVADALASGTGPAKRGR
jgi:SAM-dependent methyltransferase